MIDAWSARICADGVSRATVSAGDPRSVPATTPRSIGSVPRSWHNGTSLSSHNGTSPAVRRCQHDSGAVGRRAGGHDVRVGRGITAGTGREFRLGLGCRGLGPSPPRDSLAPVRRPVPAQALLLLSLRPLPPTDPGFVLALHRKYL